MPLPVRGIALPVLAALCLLASPDAAAQFVPSSPSTVRLPNISASARTARSQTGELALDGPVDPTEYIVGPGDVFTVSLGGGSLSNPPRQTETTVTAEGLLVVPEAGTFEAAGRRLATVTAEARTALRRRYTNVPTDIALSVPRRFAVYVSGAVPLPGRQSVTALGRVEDAIAETTGELNPIELADYDTPPQFEVERRVAFRNVRVIGRDGDERRVDLYRYYATGDLSYNPRLRDGDAVFVPSFDPVRESVTISGDVERPGYYDWRPDDTAAALVSVAGGPGLDAGGATVRRTRTTGTRIESVEVSLAEATTLDIAPRDQVSVMSATPDAGYASVVGAIAFPGAYPVVSGETTLDALVEAAGGLTRDALVRGAYLERADRPEPQAALDPLARPSVRPLSPAVFDSTVTSLGQLSGLGLAGRRYYAQEYVSTPRLSIDVASALTGRTTVFLRDGDRLVIPRDLGLIRVFGQVSTPGYVPYLEDQTAADYVSRAGGLGPAATDIYTVDARTGRFTSGSDTPVRPGDAVFVDRPPTSDSPSVENVALQQENVRLQGERLDQEAARDRRQLLIQSIATTITAISTAIFAYVQLSSN